MVYNSKSAPSFDSWILAKRRKCEAVHKRKFEQQMEPTKKLRLLWIVLLFLSAINLTISTGITLRTYTLQNLPLSVFVGMAFYILCTNRLLEVIGVELIFGPSKGWRIAKAMVLLLMLVLSVALVMTRPSTPYLTSWACSVGILFWGYYIRSHIENVTLLENHKEKESASNDILPHP